MRKLEATVIAIGNVNIQTGATCFDWSIYNNTPGVQIYLLNNDRLLYASEGSFEVGDEVLLRGNDSGRKLLKGEIKDLLPNTRDALVDALMNHGFDYRVLRAFSKKKFNRKLSTSYSIKGITSIN